MPRPQTASIIGDFQEDTRPKLGVSLGWGRGREQDDIAAAAGHRRKQLAQAAGNNSSMTVAERIMAQNGVKPPKSSRVAAASRAAPASAAILQQQQQQRQHELQELQRLQQQANGQGPVGLAPTAGSGAGAVGVSQREGPTGGAAAGGGVPPAGSARALGGSQHHHTPKLAPAIERRSRTGCWGACFGRGGTQRPSPDDEAEVDGDEAGEAGQGGAAKRQRPVTGSGRVGAPSVTSGKFRQANMSIKRSASHSTTANGQPTLGRGGGGGGSRSIRAPRPGSAAFSNWEDAEEGEFEELEEFVAEDDDEVDEDDDDDQSSGGRRCRALSAYSMVSNKAPAKSILKSSRRERDPMPDETGATGGRMPPGLRVSSEADIPAPNPHHLPHNHLYPLHHNDHNRTNGHNGVTPAAARAIAAFGPGAPPGYASNSMIIRPQHGSSGLDPAVSPTASGGAGSLAATPVGASAPVRMALPERLSSGAVAAAAAAGGGGGNGFGGSASVETSNGKLVAAAAAAPAAAAAAAASTSPGRAGPGVARKMTADELLEVLLHQGKVTQDDMHQLGVQVGPNPRSSAGGMAPDGAAAAASTHTAPSTTRASTDNGGGAVPLRGTSRVRFEMPEDALERKPSHHTASSELDKALDQTATASSAPAAAPPLAPRSAPHNPHTAPNPHHHQLTSVLQQEACVVAPFSPASASVASSNPPPAASTTLTGNWQSSPGTSRPSSPHAALAQLTPVEVHHPHQHPPSPPASPPTVGAHLALPMPHATHSPTRRHDGTAALAAPSPAVHVIRKESYGTAVGGGGGQGGRLAGLDVMAELLGSAADNIDLDPRRGHTQAPAPYRQPLPEMPLDAAAPPGPAASLRHSTSRLAAASNQYDSAPAGMYGNSYGYGAPQRGPSGAVQLDRGASIGLGRGAQLGSTHAGHAPYPPAPPSFGGPSSRAVLRASDSGLGDGRMLSAHPSSHVRVSYQGQGQGPHGMQQQQLVAATTDRAAARLAEIARRQQGRSSVDMPADAHAGGAMGGPGDDGGGFPERSASRSSTWIADMAANLRSPSEAGLFRRRPDSSDGASSRRRGYDEDDEEDDGAEGDPRVVQRSDDSATLRAKALEAVAAWQAQHAVVDTYTQQQQQQQQQQHLPSRSVSNVPLHHMSSVGRPRGEFEVAESQPSFEARPAVITNVVRPGLAGGPSGRRSVRFSAETAQKLYDKYGSEEDEEEEDDSDEDDGGRGYGGGGRGGGGGGAFATYVSGKQGRPPSGWR